MHQRGITSTPQRTARSNSRAPTAPSIIDTVASQDTRKPDFERDMDAMIAKDLKPYPNSEPRTIYFVSYARSSPHYFHGIKVGHTTAESRSNPNVLPLRESPCISPTASPQGITYVPSPRTDLSDTNEIYPGGTSGCGLDLAPKLKGG